MDPGLQPDSLDRLDAQWQYDAADWQASAGHRPLGEVDEDGLLGLVTHFGWTNEARGWFYTLMELEQQTGRDAEQVGLHEPWAGAMFVYYGLLYAVIEGCRRYRVRWLGALRSDIRAVADDLRITRNAVFHVGRPEAPYLYDARLDAVMGDPERQGAIERVHLGIARALIEEMEMRRRASQEGVDGAPQSGPSPMGR